MRARTLRLNATGEEHALCINCQIFYFDSLLKSGALYAVIWPFSMKLMPEGLSIAEDHKTGGNKHDGLKFHHISCVPMHRKF